MLCCDLCAGFVRTYVLSLDSAQYQLDVNATAAGEAPDVYATFNLLMRRDAKENNFKVRACETGLVVGQHGLQWCRLGRPRQIHCLTGAWRMRHPDLTSCFDTLTALGFACLLLLLLQAVLESIRDSLNEQLVIPEWLVDIFLGYGDAGAAHYTQMNGLLRTVDFKVGALMSRGVRHMPVLAPSLQGRIWAGNVGRRMHRLQEAVPCTQLSAVRTHSAGAVNGAHNTP